MDFFQERVTAFLPCRKGSERVPRKNIRPFGPFQYGLVEIKLAQLLNCVAVDEIVLSTNDTEIIDYAQSLQSTKLVVHHRCDSLSASTTSTDDLIKHAHDLVSSGHILWTHVTSPFFGCKQYVSVIESYNKALKLGYDSLMTATPVNGFIWNNNGPVNYSSSDEKWPRTQTLDSYYEINSAVFLASAEIYAKLENRIGDNPFIYAVDRITAMDIDWPEDFAIAEQCIISGVSTTGLN